MGFQRTDLDDPNLSPEDRRDLTILLERYLECDVWAKRAQLPIGVLITSHPSNRPYLKACVETHKELGYWMVLSYDNYFDPKIKDLSFDTYMPAKDVMDDIDTFVMPHHQTWGGVLYPYFWLLKFGLSAMESFEYVWCVNGDCILEKPENFNQIIEMLGDGDILGIGWENDRIFNTTGFLAKTSAAIAIMRHFEKYFIPLETYEEYTQELGNAEARMGKAILDLGLKQVVVPQNPINTQLHTKGGTFYDIIGFRHIHAEHNYAYRNRLIPPEIEFFDIRFTAGEYNIINEYWRTKDASVLEDWWV